MQPGSRRRGFSLVELMIVIAIISLLAVIGTVNYTRSRARANYQACVANEKNLGTSLEMYAQENGQRYATSLASITPRYMGRIPSCPGAAFTSYSGAGAYTSASNPDRYTLVCSGTNHTGIAPGQGYPQFTSAQGLIER